MENGEQLTNKTIVIRNLTDEEVVIVDNVAHKLAEDLDLEVETLTSPLKNQDTEKYQIQKVKEYLKRNKNWCITCGVCFVLGGVAIRLLTPKVYDNVTILNPSKVSVRLGDGEEVFGFESFDHRGK